MKKSEISISKFSSYAKYGLYVLSLEIIVTDHVKIIIKNKERIESFYFEILNIYSSTYIIAQVSKTQKFKDKYEKEMATL